jgi:hypothetical protein
MEQTNEKKPEQVQDKKRGTLPLMLASIGLIILLIILKLLINYFIK